jgi:hypothetical protein
MNRGTEYRQQIHPELSVIVTLTTNMTTQMTELKSIRTTKSTPSAGQPQKSPTNAGLNLHRHNGGTTHQTKRVSRLNQRR